MMVGVYPKLSVSLFEVERSSDQLQSCGIIAMVQNVSQIRAQFIDGLHPSTFLSGHKLR